MKPKTSHKPATRKLFSKKLFPRSRCHSKKKKKKNIFLCQYSRSFLLLLQTHTPAHAGMKKACTRNKNERGIEERRAACRRGNKENRKKGERGHRFEIPWLQTQARKRKRENLGRYTRNIEVVRVSRNRLSSAILVFQKARRHRLGCKYLSAWFC